MTLIERLWLLWCNRFGHKFTKWFDADGPDGTKARFCLCCGRTYHLIHGEEVQTR